MLAKELAEKPFDQGPVGICRNAAFTRTCNAFRGMIRFGKDICGNLEESTSREWLETNGLGGYASSTIAGMNTRRYHGLLVAATAPPVGRSLLLAKLEEALIIGGERYGLSVNQYPGTIDPAGHEFLWQFQLNPFPVFTYRVAGYEIQKSVFMVHGENTTVVEYNIGVPSQISATDEKDRGVLAQLEVRPLVAFRDHHKLARQNSLFNPLIHANPEIAWIQPYEHFPALHFFQNADALDPAGYWYRNFQYDCERKRGLDYEEDLYSPFGLRFILNKQRSFAIIVSTERHNIRQVAGLRHSEIRRRAAIQSVAPAQDALIKTLVAAADHYIVDREGQKTIIAGYHWFDDRGRDAMIALPGLTLVTGRYDEARSILLAFVRHMRQGLIPNRLPDSGEEPEYNSADVTLWFFEAVRALLEYSGNYPFVESHLYSAMVEMIDWHIQGTHYGIYLDDDGLLTIGEDSIQLTWMDALLDGNPVTPRRGKPVELQALWYNALRVMQELAGEFSDINSSELYSDLADRAQESFNQIFWNEPEGCLFDVVDGEFKDPTLRPNQILAASLRHTMLSVERARRVVDLVERELLTPRGLRSLTSKDAGYCTQYTGDWAARDAAYHQGTVWAWLMGPFLTACARVYPDAALPGGKIDIWLNEFQLHLTEAGVGHISEIFDGDPPHPPQGCISYARSVGEILRAVCEDVLGHRGFRPARQ